MKTILQNNIWSISSFLENKQYKFNKENILTHLPEKFIEEAIEGYFFMEKLLPNSINKIK